MISYIQKAAKLKNLVFTLVETPALLTGGIMGEETLY